MSPAAPTMKLVYGLEETKRDLLKLRKSLRRNILRRAVRAGCVVVQKDARRRVPVRTGFLRKAIAVRADNRPYGVRGSVYITKTVKARKHATVAGKFVAAKQRGFAGTIYPRAYAHLVEFGTQPHRLGRGSERSIKVRGDRVGPARNETGRMHPGARAKPFMRPAFDTQKEAAVKETEKVLRREVEAEINKLKAARRPGRVRA